MTDTTSTTTTTVRGVEVADIVAAYRAADVTGKSYMRAYAKADMKAAVTRDRDIDLAGDLSNATDAMTVAAKSTKTVDFRVTVANRRATLVAAIAAIDAGDFTLPVGVDVPAMSADDFASGDPVAADVAGFVAMSGRKSGRGDIAAHVAHVADSTSDDVATLRASAIAKSESPDYAPGVASVGAIAAYFDRALSGDAVHPDGWTVTRDDHGTKCIVRS